MPRTSPLTAASILRRKGRRPPNAARRALAFQNPRAVELYYRQALGNFAERVAKVVRSVVFPHLGKFAKADDDVRTDAAAESDTDRELSSVLGRLQTEFDRLTASPDVGKALEQVGKRIQSHTARECKRLGIKLTDAEPKLAEKIAKWRRGNLDRVHSVATDRLPELEEILRDSDGLHVDSIKRKIEARLEVSATSAERIARNQVLSLNAQVVQFRHEEAGIDEYIWTTSNDERVRGRPGGKWPDQRGSHWAHEGKKFRWDDPPIAGPNGERAHPGEFYNCRCIAFPVLPELDEDEKKK